MGRTAPLSTIHRFYIYALHGFAVEVMFTATWEFVVNLNWKLPGNTSVWVVPMYGISGLVVEYMYYKMKHSVPLLVRVLIYTLWTYCWEFSCGYTLSYFNACPWDYTHFDGDFMGLVTLEYAPLWFICCIMVERLAVRLTNQMHWGADPREKSDMNGDLKQKST